MVIFFLKHKSSVQFCYLLGVFSPVNDFAKVFPIQMHRRPNLTLPSNRSRSNQGHCLYKTLVELESPMLHTKFQDHRTLGSGEDF